MAKKIDKFLKNTETGVVFYYSEILAQRKEMMPCDVNGNRIFDETERALYSSLAPAPAEEKVEEKVEEPAAEGFVPKAPSKKSSKKKD